MTFQSTCLARGTTSLTLHWTVYLSISIHVPRKRHDASCRHGESSRLYFNPRASQEARPHQSPSSSSSLSFQSTCLARGTTPIELARRSRIGFQSTCLARGTTWYGRGMNALPTISIHVPRKRHDLLPPSCILMRLPFQSTCLARGTTRRVRRARRGREISIHVPRKRHDAFAFDGRSFIGYFNPRASQEARLKIKIGADSSELFQSTCLARGTTARRRASLAHLDFNPRASQEARLPLFAIEEICVPRVLFREARFPAVFKQRFRSGFHPCDRRSHE